MTNPPPTPGTPLLGCVILITADRRSAELGAALERRGARVVHAPALTIEPHIGDEALIEQTLQVIATPPDVVVATTGVGFHGWMETADSAGLLDELHAALAGARFIARGPKARGAIQQAGFSADWVAESETSSELGAYLLDEGISGLRVVVQHHGSGSDGLDEAFRSAGADVTSLVVYRWGPPPDPGLVARSVRSAADGAYDAVLFTSAPGADAWLEAAIAEDALDGILAQEARGSLLIAAVGPITAGPLEQAGMSPRVPDRGRLGSLVRSVVSHFAERRSAAIDTAAGVLEVRCGGALLDGELLPLTRTGHAVLSALAAAGGDVVNRSRLLASLPGATSDVHAVEVAVARIREASGAKGLIQTIVKRGYRLAVTSPDDS